MLIKSIYWLNSKNHFLFPLVDSKDSDFVKLWQFRNQNNQQGDDVDGEEGNVVMGIVRAQQEPNRDKVRNKE